MSGFRDPLDLSDIVRKYDAFKGGTSTAGVNYVQPRHVDDRADEPIPSWLYEKPRRAGSGEEPALVGSGPTRCSTSRQIAPGRPLFAWDPNRYYRDLGIPWPHVGATRKDLREAFFEAGGQDSRRLTYCIKQLLNPEVRAEYDAMPLGEQYMNDEYVQEAFKQKAADEAQARSMRGDYTTAEEVLDDWGYKIVPEEDTPQGALDTKEVEDQDQVAHEEPVGDEWAYAFYLWRTTRWDNTRLSEWQSALITELDGVSEAISTLVVGLMGKQPHRFVIAEVGGDPVVFLNRDEEVTPDLARTAATALQEQMTARSTPRAIPN